VEIVFALASALWLGILTSISPCPLASNIAAVSFIAKKFLHPWGVFLSGLAYTLGRVAAYALVGWLIISSFLSVPLVAQFLQKYMGKVLGPVLIITGFIVFFEMKIPVVKFSFSDNFFKKLIDSGLMGDFILGFICALAFCPVSAALFFGSLIPLALSSKAGSALPLIYGVGTGLPVLAIAVMIALGAKSLTLWRGKMQIVELYAKKITGVIFILAGFYYFAIYWLRLF
jgi:cytochrome c-type biogenesis protein